MDDDGCAARRGRAALLVGWYDGCAAGWERWTTMVALLFGSGVAEWYDGCAAGWERWTTKVALLGGKGAALRGGGCGRR